MHCQHAGMQASHHTSPPVSLSNELDGEGEGLQQRLKLTLKEIPSQVGGTECWWCAVWQAVPMSQRESVPK
jgi:hypothetical protein